MPALYSPGCLTSEKSMTPGGSFEEEPTAGEGAPRNPLKMLKTAKNIFGKICKSLEKSWKFPSCDSIKSKG
jgi:hypothetical protein